MNLQMTLENKIILVTGSSRGIGLATALGLAGAGAILIVHGRTESAKLDRAHAQVSALSPQSQRMPCELSDSNAIRSMFHEIASQFGRLDVLVNNAVIQNDAPFLQLSEDDWDLVFKVNLKAPFLCSQLAARMMQKQGAGKIINIGSVHEFQPRRNFAHYSSSKGGLLMLTRSMALELATFNIQVNQVTPGAIATELTLPERQQKFVSAVPAGRVGLPGEIADMVCFLASEQVNYVTGASFVVDGGLTLGFCASRSDL
jgi:glucose 1-dehydrogenase